MSIQLNVPHVNLHWLGGIEASHPDSEEEKALQTLLPYARQMVDKLAEFPPGSFAAHPDMYGYFFIGNIYGVNNLYYIFSTQEGDIIESALALGEQSTLELEAHEYQNCLEGIKKWLAQPAVIDPGFSFEELSDMLTFTHDEVVEGYLYMHDFKGLASFFRNLGMTRENGFTGTLYD